MKLKLTGPELRFYQRTMRGKSETAPRVSHVIETVHGPLRMTPEQLKPLAEFGKIVHQGMAGKRIKNDVAKKYVRSGFAFLKKRGAITIMKEFPIWCEHVIKSRLVTFAGTPDRWTREPMLLSRKKLNVLNEWKTGAASERHRLQINFYDMGAFASYGVKFDLLLAVRLMEKEAKPEIVRRDWARVFYTLEQYFKIIGGKK